MISVITRNSAIQNPGTTGLNSGLFTIRFYPWYNVTAMPPATAYLYNYLQMDSTNILPSPLNYGNLLSA